MDPQNEITMSEEQTVRSPDVLNEDENLAVVEDIGIDCNTENNIAKADATEDDTENEIKVNVTEENEDAGCKGAKPPLTAQTLSVVPVRSFNVSEKSSKLPIKTVPKNTVGNLKAKPKKIAPKNVHEKSLAHESTITRKNIVAKKTSSVFPAAQGPEEKDSQEKISKDGIPKPLSITSGISLVETEVLEMVSSEAEVSLTVAGEDMVSKKTPDGTIQHFAGEDKVEHKILETTGEQDNFLDLPKERIVFGVLIFPFCVTSFKQRDIKAILKTSTNVLSRFYAARGKRKEGILQLEFEDEDSQKYALNKLHYFRPFGGSKPQVLSLIEPLQTYRGIVRDKLKEFIGKRTFSHPLEVSDQPVSVFVSNIPEDTQAEILNFLYPSSLNIQLPVNDQGSTQRNLKAFIFSFNIFATIDFQMHKDHYFKPFKLKPKRRTSELASMVSSYAIIQFPNLQEARNVVENNKTYPAEIGGNLLNMYVIGHEEENTDNEDKPVEKKIPPPKKVNQKGTTERERKRNAALESRETRKRKKSKTKDSYSPVAKTHPKKGDQKKTSERDRKRYAAWENRETSISKKSKTDDSKWPSRRTSASEEKRETAVFIGGLPTNLKSEKLERWLWRELVERHICTYGLSPFLYTRSFGRNPYKIVMFRNLLTAQKVVQKMNGCWYNSDVKLDFHMASREEMSIPECVSDKDDSDEDDFPEECTVYVSNVPTADTEAYTHFFNNQFIIRGFCEEGENVVQKIIFKKRSTIEVVFFTENDARNAVEALDRVRFRTQVIRIRSVKDIQMSERCPSETRDKVSAERGEGYDVLVGNLPIASPKDIVEFFKAKMVLKGLAKSHENTIATIKYKHGRKYQFLVFNRASVAEACVSLLDKVKFNGNELLLRHVRKHDEERGKEGRKNVTDMGGASAEAYVLGVYISHLPECTRDEIIQFVHSQLILFGLCKEDESPIKDISYMPHRNHQFLIFHRLKDALACLRILKGAAFKGSRLRVKAGNALTFSGPKEAVSLASRRTDIPTLQPADMTQRNVETVEDKAENYPVFIGNVPSCSAVEFLNFIRSEFYRRGLLVKDEKTVVSLDFVYGRNFQYAMFANEYDAKAAVEELDGEVFLGSKLSTRVNKNLIQQFENIQQKHDLSDVDTAHSDPPSHKIYVRNLPMGVSRYTLTPNLLKELIKRGAFRPDQNPIKSVDHTRNSTFMFVEFYTEADARVAAQALNGISLEGNIVQATYQERAQTRI